MLPSSAGAEIGPEENSEAAGPIFKKLAFGVLTNDRTFAKRTEPSRVLFFWLEAVCGGDTLVAGACRTSRAPQKRRLDWRTGDSYSG
jgi:hypothetical protein